MWRLRKWQKFEQFNFIVDPSNEFHTHLKLYFQFMKETYLVINNVCEAPDQSLNAAAYGLDMVKYVLDGGFDEMGE